MSLNRFKYTVRTNFDNFNSDISNKKKRNHWMWFMFPQIEGLGRSFNAQEYAIQNLEEANAFWNEPFLQKHYLLSLNSILSLGDAREIKEFLGSTDFDKLKSSLTLFNHVTDNKRILVALDHIYEISRCEYTNNYIKESFRSKNIIKRLLNHIKIDLK